MNAHTMQRKRRCHRTFRLTLAAFGQMLKRAYSWDVVNLVPSFDSFFSLPDISEADLATLPPGADWSDSIPCPVSQVPDEYGCVDDEHPYNCPACFGCEKLPIPGRGVRARKAWLKEKQAQDKRHDDAYAALAAKAPRKKCEMPDFIVEPTSNGKYWTLPTKIGAA